MFIFKKPVCESPYHCIVISVSLANMSFLDAGENHYNVFLWMKQVSNCSIKGGQSFTGQ